MSDFDKEFGSHIRKMRKDYGITQTELGNRIGVGRATVSNYESGKRKIPFETAREIYTALGHCETLSDGTIVVSHDFYDWFELPASAQYYEKQVKTSLFRILCNNFGYDVIVNSDLAEERSFVLTNVDGVNYQREFFRGSKSEQFIPDIFYLHVSEEEIIAFEHDILGYFVTKLDDLICEKGESPLSKSPFFRGFNIDEFDPFK